MRQNFFKGVTIHCKEYRMLGNPVKSQDSHSLKKDVRLSFTVSHLRKTEIFQKFSS